MKDLNKTNRNKETTRLASNVKDSELDKKEQYQEIQAEVSKNIRTYRSITDAYEKHKNDDQLIEDILKQLKKDINNTNTTKRNITAKIMRMPITFPLKNGNAIFLKLEIKISDGRIRYIENTDYEIKEL